MLRVVGIDEAGRGPVIGPLVVAAVAGPSMDFFAELGCRDSKKLTPDRRRALDRQLRSHPEVSVFVRAIDAATIDLEMQRRTLNEIEMARFRELALESACPNVFADAADVDADRFRRELAAGLPRQANVVAEHKADDTYAVVGAASIIAKVARDAAVESLGRLLERELGMELGSGYPSDATTQRFLEAWVKRFDDLPPETRRSWKTAKALFSTGPQARLDRF